MAKAKLATTVRVVIREDKKSVRREPVCKSAPCWYLPIPQMGWPRSTGAACAVFIIMGVRFLFLDLR